MRAAVIARLLCGLLLVAASESRRGGRGRRAMVDDFSEINPYAGVPNPCTTPGQQGCCGDGKCEGAESEITCMADCPGVTTDETCGEEPHSDRGGKGRTFGVSHRTASAQECCDKCKKWTKQGGCNSWTFCGYPVCFGLDTGWNHTFGECWLRQLADPAQPTFGQRGKYAMRYRKRMLRTRKACTSIDTPGGLSPGWVCPPTHVPWTSGSVGVKADLTTKWQTGGGWGNMRIHKLDASGNPIESSCTRNGGRSATPASLIMGDKRDDAVVLSVRRVRPMLRLDAVYLLRSVPHAV